MECGSKDECECDKKYEEVNGECVKEDKGGSGEAGGAVAASKALSEEDQAVLDCYEGKDGAKKALDTNDEKKAEENLKKLECGVEDSDKKCVEECIKEIKRDCRDDLNDSGSGSGDDDCKDLADDFVKCLEEDCYPAE